MLPVPSAFLCLKRKYDIKSLNDEARKRIYSLFPITLRELDASDGCYHTETTLHHADILSLLLLARRKDLLSILSLELYLCCRDHSAHEIQHGIAGNRSMMYFPRGNQLTLLAAHRDIIVAQFNTTYRWIAPESYMETGCSIPNVCTLIRQGY